MAYTITSLSRISCFNSATLVWLEVSLPSEITTIAFLRCLPVSARGIASATPSYIAVPPLGEILPSARVNCWRSLVHPWSSVGWSLNR